MKRVSAYAKNAQETFFERPLSAGDALVFSSVSYLDFLPELFSFPFALKDTFGVIPGNRVLYGCAFSGRFKDVQVVYQNTVFLRKPHCQYSVTAFLFDKSVFIAFRGTDETVTGWLEDFDIIHSKKLYSHELSIRDLNEIGKQFPDHTLYVGGHSKGGHLATYSASFCDEEVKKRIKKVYCFDGPGVLPEVRYSPEYKETLQKTEKYVPVSSFIGMILTGSDPVLPAASFGFWFQKHDHFSWYVNDDGSMVARKKLKPIALKTKRVFQKVITALSREERLMFTDIAERTLVYAEIKNIYRMSLRSIRRIFHYLLVRVRNKEEKKFLKWIRKEFLIGFLSPFCK